jgi:hypothetical protein
MQQQVLLLHSIKHIDLTSFFRYSLFHNITKKLKFIANPFKKGKLFHRAILFRCHKNRYCPIICWYLVLRFANTVTQGIQRNVMQCSLSSSISSAISPGELIDKFDTSAFPEGRETDTTFK